MVLEFWLTENKKVLFCKPIWMVMCPVLFMLVLLLEKGFSQQWVQDITWGQLWLQELSAHHYYLEEQKVLFVKK